ncbi:MAG: DASS family sodium-coupled anion symporter [Candidatus Korobacteraceae bacterium]
MAATRQATAADTSPAGRTGKSYKLVYFVVGLAILMGSIFLPPAAGMRPEAVRAMAVIVTTVLWWVTETLPVPITALMVPVMVHALRIIPLDDALRESFGNPLIPFMVGVLGLAVALSASGLGKRISYYLLAVIGTNTAMIVGGYLWISFVISMFIDDIAVVAMMLPLVLGLLKTVDAKPGSSNFGRALMMAIIFGAVLGGICTPAGVSSNIITLAFLNKNANMNVSFFYWTIIATPISVVITAITWWLILRLFPPEIKHLPYGRDVLQRESKALGPWTVKEKTTTIVFLAAIVLWLSSDLTKFPIALVSLLILGGITLPRVGVFDNWRDLNRGIEWGGVMLVVGGFIVGIAASKSGLASWAVQRVLHPMALLPVYLQPLAVTLLMAVDSLGFSSFGTTASVNVPFIIAYAQQHGLPVLSLTLTAGFASSIHFILVTQTPSLVLPFAYGYFSFKDLAKIGILVTLVSAAVIDIGMVMAGMPAGVPMMIK